MSAKSRSAEKMRKLEWSEIPGLIKETVLDFLEENGLFHGAAIAYYTLFAMVPLFYLAITIFGRIIGQGVMLDIIQDLLKNKIGIQDVSGIMQFLEQFNFSKGNFFMEIVSIVALLIASSAFLVGLKESINEFYDLEINYSTKRKKLVKNVLFRLLSVLFLGIMTLVVIIVYFSQAIVMSMSSSWFNDSPLVNIIFSGAVQHGFAILTNLIIFMLVFKYVHDGSVRWKVAFVGSLVTSILMYVGQLLIKYYLFNYFFGSKGGLIGSLFVILAWIYYSSQIIFFGAKFTAVYARKTGVPIHFKE